MYELDIEIWPRLHCGAQGLSRRPVGARARIMNGRAVRAVGLGTLGAVFTGVGPFKHDDPRDRPADVYGGEVTIHMGPDRPSHLLLPIIPA